MLLFMKLTLGMGTHFLLFLTAMEVQTTTYLGPEVSRYVSKVFVDLLKRTTEYGKKQYVKALDYTFMKIDDLIDS